MTDTAAVRTAVDGLRRRGARGRDVLLQAPRPRARWSATTVVGTAGGARRRRATPAAGVLVHVSSTVALARPGGVAARRAEPAGHRATVRTPPARSPPRRVARRLQEAGDPVTIVNPGGILGPHDPYLGESNEVVRPGALGQTAGLPARPPAVRRRARHRRGPRRCRRPRAREALPRARPDVDRPAHAAARGDRPPAAGADRCPRGWRSPARCRATSPAGRSCPGRPRAPGSPVAPTPSTAGATTRDLGVTARPITEESVPTPSAGSSRRVTCPRSSPAGRLTHRFVSGSAAARPVPHQTIGAPKIRTDLPRVRRSSISASASATCSTRVRRVPIGGSTTPDSSIGSSAATAPACSPGAPSRRRPSPRRARRCC